MQDERKDILAQSNIPSSFAVGTQKNHITRDFFSTHNICVDGKLEIIQNYTLLLGILTKKWNLLMKFWYLLLYASHVCSDEPIEKCSLTRAFAA